MKDFAGYTPQGEQNASTAEWTAETNKLIASFQGKSERDMMRAILQRATEGKRSGTLTNEQIDAFYAQFSPMLDGQKKKKLKKVVEDLKKL